MGKRSRQEMERSGVYTNNEDGVRNLKRCLEIIHTKLNLYRLMRPGTNLFEKDMSLEVKFPMTALMIHEHAQGEKVAPHIRASIYIPGTGNERTIIDVDWNSWEKLDIAEV